MKAGQMSDMSDQSDESDTARYYIHVMHISALPHNSYSVYLPDIRDSALIGPTQSAVRGYRRTLPAAVHAVAQDLPLSRLQNSKEFREVREFKERAWLLHCTPTHICALA